MAFTPEQRSGLLALKGVGPTVLMRLEALGLSDLTKLAVADPREVVASVSVRLGSTCWKNSPQALKAVTQAIAWAESQGDHAPVDKD